MPGTMSPQEVLRILLEKERGFKPLFIFKYKENVVEFKVEYRKIPIDFFFYTGEKNEVLSPLFFYEADKTYPSVNANSIKQKFMCVNHVISIHIIRRFCGK